MEVSRSEILSRIAQVTTALAKLKPIWKDKNIKLRTKVRLLRSLVISQRHAELLSLNQSPVLSTLAFLFSLWFIMFWQVFSLPPTLWLDELSAAFFVKVPYRSMLPKLTTDSAAGVEVIEESELA